MAPYSQHFHSVISCDDLIDEPMLNIDSPGVCALQVTHKFLVGWRITEGIVCNDRKQNFSLFTQASGSQFLGIFLGLLREDDVPAHQPGSGLQASSGVARPS